ncbi:MAG: SMI1/KNR4 family protein [Bacteroidales bacterium]|nr:SMI1/KNR4 family protein [Bacteroidales bacterium]
MTKNKIDQQLERLREMKSDPKFPTHFERPASADKIRNFEAKYHIKLPDSYKKFLMQYNGGMFTYPQLSKYIQTQNDYELHKHNSVYLMSIEEIEIKYDDLMFSRWKVRKETADPYPVIPFCTTINSELLVFIHGEKSGKESPVFDAFHEEPPSTWGIIANNFANFLEIYLNARGFPRTIGNETAGVAGNYFDNPLQKKEITETSKEILSRTEQQIAANPKDDFAYYERSQVFFDRGDLTEAWEMIARAIEIDNKNAFYYFISGEILREGDLIRASLIAFDKAVNLEPKDTLYLCCRAGAFYQLRKNEKALEDCNRAVEIDPEHLLAYMLRNEVYLALGEKEKAAADQEKIDELNSKKS